MAEPVAVLPATTPPPRVWSLDRQMIPRLLLVWLAAVTVALLVRNGVALPRLGKPFAAMLVESVVYLLYFGTLLSVRPVRAYLRAIPSPHRMVLAGFFFLLTTGQLTLMSRRTFPFPAWTMYGRPESPSTLEYYRYHGVDRSGRTMEIDPAKLFTFVNVAEIDSRVKFFARPASSSRDLEAREEARAKVRDWLMAIGTAYNLRNPETPLRSLEFLRYNWEFRRIRASEVPAESVLRVELAPGDGR
jgi:hypothetical protein